MNPMLRFLIRNGRHSGGGTTPPPGGATLQGIGYNMSSNSSVYYGQVWPFRNLQRSGGGPIGNFGAFDANGHIHNLADGDDVTIAVVFSEASPNFGVVPPGNYIVHSPAGLTCSVDTANMGSNGGLTNIVQGTSLAKDCTFTVPPGSDSAITMYIKFHNGTGGVISDPNTYVGLVSSKAGWDAGDFWDPTFISELLAGNVDHVRIQGWIGQNSMTADGLDVSRINSINNRVWLSDDAIDFGGKCPPEVAADLAAKLTCKLWLCLASGDDQFLYSFDHTTNLFTLRQGNANIDPSNAATAIPWPENTPVVLNSFNGFSAKPGGFNIRTQTYYVHTNADPTKFQLKDASGGAIVVGTTDIVYSPFDQYAFNVAKQHTQSEMRTYYANVMQRVKTYWDNIGYNGVILPEVSNEPWNSGYKLNYFFGAPSMSAAAGGNPAAGYAWSQMCAIVAADGIFGADHVIATVTGQAAFFNGFGRPALEYVDNQGILDATRTKTVGRILELRGGYYTCDMYIFPSLSGDDSAFPPALAAGSSWGTGDRLENNGFYSVGDKVHEANGHDYVCILQHVPDNTNRSPNGTYWNDLGLTPLVGIGVDWTDAMWEFAWKRGMDRLIGFHTGSQGARTYLDANYPALGWISYESGFGLARKGFGNGHSYGQITQAELDVYNAALTFRNTAGRANNVIDYFVDVMLKPLKLKSITQYSGFGNHWYFIGTVDGSPGTLEAWGLKKTPQSPDNVWATRMRLRASELT